MLRVRPLTLKQANSFIAEHHRHHKPVQGHRFSIGAYDGDVLVGVCTIGRPVSRNVPQYLVAEVTRLATSGGRNVCSLLYGAAARACKAMGFEAIQTYTLLSEPGTSLRAAGWVAVSLTKGGDWNSKQKPNRRVDQPMEPKTRWERAL